MTAGIHYKKIKLEASGFHGSEPGENRWIIQQGPSIRGLPDCGSFRRKIGRRRCRWENRASGSVGVWRPDPSDGFVGIHEADGSGKLVFQPDLGTQPQHCDIRNLNSYLAESVLPVNRRNFMTGPLELVDKDELFAGQPESNSNRPLYGSTFRIGAYTLGYTRDIDLFRACRDRHRRQLHRLLASGRDQAVLWRPSRRRQRFRSFSAQARIAAWSRCTQKAKEGIAMHRVGLTLMFAAMATAAHAATLPASSRIRCAAPDTR